MWGRSAEKLKYVGEGPRKKYEGGVPGNMQGVGKKIIYVGDGRQIFPFRPLHQVLKWDSPKKHKHDAI